MKPYEYNYRDNYYEVNNNPGFNPLWLLAVAALTITVLALIYN